MKKLITLMMSLLIMTTMMSASIHADDTSDVDINGGSQNVDVSTTENISYAAATDDEVYKVTVSWSTTPAVYDRTDKLVWNPDTLNYDVFKEENIGEAATVDASATITITNYSNREIDYGIFFSPKKVNEADITSEAPATAGTDLPSGSIASADSTGEIQSGTNTNVTNNAVYHGTISYTDGYVASDTTNTEMGSYAVKISKHLALNNTALTIKKGKTATLTVSTPVTWSSSNTNVATVDSTGKVKAIADGTTNITATSNATCVTVTCAVTVRSDIYGLTNSQDDFDLLLASDTVDFTYNDITYTAYNGFIKETKYATWYEAQNFVNELNNENIAPSGKTNPSDGKWMLINSYAMAKAWISATKTETGDKSDGYSFSSYIQFFGGNHNLWTSAENGSGDSCVFYCIGGTWSGVNKSYSYGGLGYVVIWQPTVSE